MVSTVQIIGEFWENRSSGMSDVAPILLAETANNFGAAWLPAFIGEARNICRAYRSSRANLQHQQEVFMDFFIFAALRLLAKYES